VNRKHVARDNVLHKRVNTGKLYEEGLKGGVGGKGLSGRGGRQRSGRGGASFISRCAYLAHLVGYYVTRGWEAK
jgi:hypothetical protein